MKKLFLIFIGLMFVFTLALPINVLADDAAAPAPVEKTDDASAEKMDEGSSDKKEASTDDGGKEKVSEEAAMDKGK